MTIGTVDAVNASDQIMSIVRENETLKRQVAELTRKSLDLGAKNESLNAELEKLEDFRNLAPIDDTWIVEIKDKDVKREIQKIAVRLWGKAGDPFRDTTEELKEKAVKQINRLIVGALLHVLTNDMILQAVLKRTGLKRAVSSAIENG